jgi:hypothetical protein
MLTEGLKYYIDSGIEEGLGTQHKGEDGGEIK